MVATITGQFLGVEEITLKDKSPMKLMQVLQQSKRGGFTILNIPIENGYQVPKLNEKVTIEVSVSAFLSKKDNTAKLGVRIS